MTGRFLQLRFHKDDATIEVIDRRNGRVYCQETLRWPRTTVRGVTHTGNALHVSLLQQGVEFEASFELDDREAAVAVELQAASDTPLSKLVYPYPFVLRGDSANLVWPLREGLVVPMNEDISQWPQQAQHLFRWVPFHMPWFGMADLADGAGVMILCETPHDMRFVADPKPPTLAMQWLGEFKRFSYPRRMRYVFFTSGGYVAMCQRYRQYLQQIGWFRTLAEKAKINPNVAKLPGAVVLWWPRMSDEVVHDLIDSGVRRVLIMGGTPGSAEWVKQVPKDPAARFEWFKNRRRAEAICADRYRDTLIKWYGPEKGKQIKHAEFFEISEYGRRRLGTTRSRLL
ncbi:MAG: hypothetical protein GXP27_15735 [Planctomycetes bacterium]|nr:hypothetical protein [Planctomycetota bacterium]